MSYGHERVGISRNGRLAAVIIPLEDLEMLERLENERDLADYRAANARDDGGWVGLSELVTEIGE